MADIDDETSTAAAVENSDAVVNAVSLYVERGDVTYMKVHVTAAERLVIRISNTIRWSRFVGFRCYMSPHGRLPTTRDTRASTQLNGGPSHRLCVDTVNAQ